jgi:hypothetical protein
VLPTGTDFREWMPAEAASQSAGFIPAFGITKVDHNDYQFGTV